MISEITPEISITDSVTAASSPLAELGYRALLCLDAGSLADRQRLEGLEVCIRHLHPQESSLAPFNDAVATLASLIEEHGRVLVHCNMGECRSVCVVAAYLVRKHGERPDEALSRVARLRKSPFIPRGLEILVLSQD